MKNKKLLLITLFSLLSLGFILPVFAQPSYLLGPNDVPGWTLYKSSNENVNYTSSTMSMYWQIWINAKTWENATKAVCLMVVEFPQDISDAIWTALKIGFNSSAKVKPIPGLTDAYIWNEGNLYIGIGYNGNVFLIAIGYNQTVAPGNPFGAFWMSKTPTETNANENDISTILAAQGAEFLTQIPGFEFVFILISVEIIVGIVWLVKRQKTIKI
ncbi:MAG: hypothetical protein ACTSQO_07840 [Candidatus Helarchaeota archaeon]